MKPPESIKIGPFHYRFYSDAEHTVQMVRESGDRIGQINYRQLEICIIEDVAPERRVVALLHEVLHGVFHAAGLYHEEGATLDAEQVLEAMPAILLDVLRSNPDLATYLLYESVE